MNKPSRPPQELSCAGSIQWSFVALTDCYVWNRSDELPHHNGWNDACRPQMTREKRPSWPAVVYVGTMKTHCNPNLRMYVPRLFLIPLWIKTNWAGQMVQMGDLHVWGRCSVRLFKQYLGREEYPPRGGASSSPRLYLPCVEMEHKRAMKADWFRLVA